MSSEEKWTVQTHTVEGHSVEIRQSGEREQLYIDGVRHKFFKSKFGYVLPENAFVPPVKSLLEAVEAHLKRDERPGRGGGHHALP